MNEILRLEKSFLTFSNDSPGLINAQNSLFHKRRNASLNIVLIRI